MRGLKGLVYSDLHDAMKEGGTQAYEIFEDAGDFLIVTELYVQRVEDGWAVGYHLANDPKTIVTKKEAWQPETLVFKNRSHILSHLTKMDKDEEDARAYMLSHKGDESYGFWNLGDK